MATTARLLIAGAVAAAAACAPENPQKMVNRNVAAAGPAAGVTLALASERAARVSDLRYELAFTIPDAATTPVTGTVTLRFRLAGAAAPLALDFAGPAAGIRDVRAQGSPLTPVIADEHVVFPAAALRDGENELTLSFEASDLALNRHPDFLYTLFVPARARLVFPCFDQPDLKARYRVTLTTPAGWTAVANAPEQEHTASAAAVTRRFAETRPIPTYLLAFAAGRFSTETADRGGRRFRMLHRETDAAKVARNRDAIFDLHARALAWLEDYTAIPYPFDKFDFVLLPAFQFGGMEHPGAVFYNAPALFLDPSATQNQQLGRASLIAHETAHMWFGDLVTMRWFDDVWMKEVFANFMAAKIVNPSFPAINHDLRFLYAHYPAAYEVDRTAGTNAIRQRLDNLAEAGSLYGAIIYQKAPIVMRQLEMMVTPDGLRDGLREYLTRHAYGNASWPDLIALLDRRTAADLAAWSRAWVETAGRPEIASEVKAGGDAPVVTFTQTDPAGVGDLSWSQQLAVVVAADRRTATVPIAAQGRVYQAPLPFDGRPDYVLPTGGGIGYGDFVLDADSRAFLMARLAGIADPLTRGAALVTLWEEMLGGRVRAEAMFDLLSASLPHESDELNVARMLSGLQRVFWKHLPADARRERAASLETMLRTGLARATTQSVKSAWFAALREVATTTATLDWLERVWNRRETIPGLTFAEPDDITLALDLAVREVPGWQRILDGQQARIENPDRRAQFAFVRPALSADAAVRDAFFDSLREAGNRRREPWVLQGVAYLHHPLRAAAAEQYIPASLALLEEIQRTGDIFFPKRWMDATLNGHRSASAARMVSGFLERVPEGYPERLRRIVLSSADELFRASRTRDR